MDARVKLDAPPLVIRPVWPETPPESPLAMPQQRVSADRVRLHGETDGRWRLGTYCWPPRLASPRWRRRTRGAP
jgi:hypothetical protein